MIGAQVFVMIAGGLLALCGLLPSCFSETREGRWAGLGLVATGLLLVFYAANQLLKPGGA